MDWLRALLEALGPKFFSRRGKDRDFRIKANLLARVHPADGSDVITARVANLSRRGFKLLLPTLLQRDAQVLVHLLGDVRPQSSIKVEAAVVWAKKQGKYYDAGFEWRGFHDTQYDDVVQFFKDEVRLDVGETARRLRSPRRAMEAYAVRYSMSGDHRSLKGTVQNMSLTGLRFRGEEEVPIGTTLHIFVDLAPRKRLSVIGTVRRCAAIRGGGWDIGATMRADDAYNEELLKSELARYAPSPTPA